MISQQNNPEVANQEQAWLTTAAGIYWQENAQSLFDEAVFDLFGFNALQMGMAQLDLLQNSRIPNRFIASTTLTTNSQLYCADDFLPFAETSLDLLLLPHRLEFSERPHQTLREAARVMMPEGHLIITGFNPLSSWGLKSYVKKVIQFFKVKKFKSHESTISSKKLWLDFPWHARMIRLSRLKDWLALLGFEIVSVEMICHAPPFSHESWLKKCTGLDEIGRHYLRRLGLDRFGGVYFIVAKKRVPGMTPLKPKWKTSPITSVLVTRPKSQRHHQQKSLQADQNKYDG